MTCKSAIYTVNATNSAVTTTAGTFVQVPFGSVVRRFGNSLGLDGGSILCCREGYFEVNGSCSYTAEAAGPVTVQIRQDGIPVPGLTATATAAAAGDVVSLPLSGLVRNCGCDRNSTLTCWIDAPGNITNLAVVIDKE